MATMSKRERLEATFRGEAVDRPAVALWRHWPGDDQRPEDLARAQIAFQRTYDYDFIKVTPSSGFCVYDWGVRSEYRGSAEGSREYVKQVITSPEDWERLPVLDPSQGALGRQLRCLELIRAGVGAEVPFIQTVFNPLCMARYLAGEEQMLMHLRRYPDALRRGLEIITETSCRFVRQAMRTGVAGIFLAVLHASYRILTEDQYNAFGRPYDLQVLEATRGAWFNLLHLHGNDIMFDPLCDYPAQLINWHDRETSPSLAEGQKRFDGAVCGGLRQWKTMVYGSPEDVLAEASEALAQTGGRRFVLGSGCVAPVVTPTSNLMAARRAVE